MARHQRHDTHDRYLGIKEYRDIVEFIATNDDFVIGSHEQPDGDAIGSTFAFYRILDSLRKKARVLYSIENIPTAYRFLAIPEAMRSKSNPIGAFENAIILECPNLARLGGELSEIASRAKTVINIDHHTQNDMFGRFNLLIPEAPSTTEIVYRMALDLGAKIDKSCATALYAGLVSDTGRFQYSSTTGDTLRVAAELLDYGVEPYYVFQQIYEQTSYSTLKLLARMLGRIKLEDQGITWSIIRRADIKATGANLLETENFVDFVRSVEGTEVAALFKETATGHRVSLRSRGSVDVAAFCWQFGGGGHKRAAGCKTTLSPRRFLTALKRYISTGKLPPYQPFAKLDEVKGSEGKSSASSQPG